MPDPDPPNIADTLKALIMDEIKGNRRNLKQLAADAEVPYQVLQKWSRGEVAKLDVGVAEKLYQTLTGKAFGNV